MPSERPVRSATCSSAAGCLPTPSRAEPRPNAGTTAQVGNFTVRLAPLEDAPPAGSTADASDDATTKRHAKPAEFAPVQRSHGYSLYDPVHCANRGGS